MFAQEKLLQQVGRIATVAEALQQIGGALLERQDDERADERTETFDAEAVVELLDRLGVALRVLDRSGVESDDVEQELVGVAGLPGERDVGGHCLPVDVERLHDAVEA